MSSAIWATSIVAPALATRPSISRTTSVMVARGVPSSCAAAAARPSSWREVLLSRASTSSVAARASDSCRASSATRDA